MRFVGYFKVSWREQIMPDKFSIASHVFLRVSRHNFVAGQLCRPDLQPGRHWHLPGGLTGSGLSPGSLQGRPELHHHVGPHWRRLQHRDLPGILWWVCKGSFWHDRLVQPHLLQLQPVGGGGQAVGLSAQGGAWAGQTLSQLVALGDQDVKVWHRE